MNPAVTVRGLDVRYDDVMALTGVDLSLDPGRVIGLVGMNGAGKSTLFAALLGLVRPHAGSLTIAGMSSRAARRAGLLGHMPQAERIDWSFPISVRDVVMTGRQARQSLGRRHRPSDVDAVESALHDVGLSELADRQIGRLSGGQRKRAFVARCMAQQAEVLLLDEPFAGVDRQSEATISAVLRQLAATGSTVIVSTHGLHTLPTLADEVVLLRQRVLFHGPAGDALAPDRLAATFGLVPPEESS